MTKVEQIQKSVQALSDPERDHLIELLISQGEEDQIKKIGRRIEEINSGEVEGIPCEEVFAKARKMLHDRK